MNINDWYDLLVGIYLVGAISYVIAFGTGSFKIARVIMVAWILCLLVYTANRPLDLGTDTEMYSNAFKLYTTNITYDYVPIHQQLSYFFFGLGKLAAFFSDQFPIFLYFVSGFFLVTTYFTFKLIFEKNWHFPFFIFTSTFIYYSFLFNLIRNSLIVGGAFLALYLFFYNPTKKRKILGIGVIAALFFIHSSAGLIGVAILATSFIKSERQAFIIWFCALFLGVFGIDVFKVAQSSVISLFPNSALAYKTGVYDRVTKSGGFRIDFVLFTFFFGVIGYYISVNWRNPFYSNLVKWYLIQGSMFMLFFSFPYVDRIASLAWMGFPLIIGYPTIYWKGLRPYRFQVGLLTFLFGLINLLLVARYDFHLDLF